MKKFVKLFLICLIVCSLLSSLYLSVSAESTVEQEGLKVTIVTDKEKYSLNDDIEISVDIENTKSFQVNDVSVEVILPEGFEAMKGELSESGIDIKGNETHTSDKVMKMSDELRATEGALMRFIIGIAIGALSLALLVLCIVFAIKRKKAVKVMSFFLCLIMVASMLPVSAMAANDAMTITADKNIIVGSKEYTLKARVSVPVDSLYEKCTVSFDTAGGSKIASETIVKGSNITVSDTTEREGFALIGWYADKNYKEPFDFTQPVNESCTLYARWIDIADTTDSDGDGLTDPFEEYYETDLNDKDTDDDGIDDYTEVTMTSYDPLKKDTDDNGTNDGKEDLDGDGINNASELDMGTDLSLADTDGDNLNDKDELDKYDTDPVLYDTDEDGVSDGREIELGTDPLTLQEVFDVAMSASNYDSVKASVEIELSGEQVESLSVEPVSTSYFFPETMPGYMGHAYDFSVDGSIGSATISFEFDESLLLEGADPVIYYFNEEKKVLEELDTTINGNVASTTVDHLLKYILIDRTLYNDGFEWIDVWDIEGTYTDIEIVFVIDDSGSMDWNDPGFERLSVARTLIDNLPEGSKIGLVRFDGDEPKTEALTSSLTMDKDLVKGYLTTDYFYSPGGTDMYNGIQKAFPLYESKAESTMRMMIVLSDGETDDTHLHSTVVSEAVSMGVRVYTVGLGSSSSYFTNYLKPLAQDTGAEFYMADDADELAEIYKDINDKIDIETDSDKDGVSDYYEDHMVAFNGEKIKLDKKRKDTDGDGLYDGDEVEIIYEYNDTKTRVKVFGTFVRGNPADKDTDDDTINDKDDKTPFSYTITDRTLAMVQGLSYTNLSNYVGHTVEYALQFVSLESNITKEDIKCLNDAYIIAANDSAKGFWGDFLDAGLGLVALKFERYKENDAVIFAIRGSEFETDTTNDIIADVALGLGWDCYQSRMAFDAYRRIATDKNVDYYITGHSLGGRLALDVTFKTYNANDKGLFKKSANIQEPVHITTFNGLGYNTVVFASLFARYDLISQYEDKLTNFYYWQDLVGEGLGVSGVYLRPGKNVMLEGRTGGGDYLRDRRGKCIIVYIRDVTYHGIEYFVRDYDLKYNSAHHWKYWRDK